MNITLISVPFDQDFAHQEMGRAPHALKADGLLDRLRARGVNVQSEAAAPTDLGAGDRIERLGRLGRAVADEVAAAHARETLPVILGGDCINAIGVMAGLRRALGEAEFGVAWFDAHGDFNTPETTLSGYLGGMPLAASCGHGLDDLRTSIGLERLVDERHVIMLGVRDLDPPEKALLDSTPISYLSPAEVEAGSAATAAGHHFQGAAGVYLHFDIDVLKLSEAPGVSYRAPEGMSSGTALAAVQAIREVAPLAALTLSAVNPEKDVDGVTVETGIRLLVEILAA